MKKSILGLNSARYYTCIGTLCVSVAFASCAPTNTTSIEKTQSAHLAMTDPATIGVWQERTTLGPIRGAAIAFDRARAKVVLFGGSSGTGKFLDDTWEWDGREMRWLRQHPTNSPPRRVYSGMAFDELRTAVVLFSGTSLDYLRDTWEWDGVNWTEKFAAASPEMRQRHQMAFDPDKQEVILFGGYGFESNLALGDTWSWNGTAWNKVADGPARDSTAMAFDPARLEVIRFGGNDANFDVTDTTAVWNNKLWTTLNPPTLPTSREGAVLSEAWNAMLLFGGANNDNTALDDTWSWDGATWSELKMTVRPPARTESAMAWDGQRLVLTGGLDNDSKELDDTWTWDTTWSISKAANPPGVKLHNLAYDESRQKVVLFGGYDVNNDTIAQTWEWDGDWQLRNPAHSPPARLGHAMTYDASRKQTLLFGGWSPGKYFDDTWIWDGVDWKEVFPDHAPEPRQFAAMAYDHERRLSILHGGLDEDNSITDETWAWNGVDWIQLPVSGPGVRVRHALVDHRTRKELVLFGGIEKLPGSTPTSNDTWIWNGSSWSKQTPMNVPTARCHHAMAFNPFRDRVILFGGEQGSTAFDDVWEWDGADWHSTEKSKGPPVLSRGAMVFAEMERGALLFGGEVDGSPGGQITHATWLYKTRGGSCKSKDQCDTPNCLIEAGESIGVCCESASCGECGRCNTETDPGRCAIVPNIRCGAPAYCGNGLVRYSMCNEAGSCIPDSECEPLPPCKSGGDCPAGFRCRYDERCVPDEPYAPPSSAWCMLLSMDVDGSKESANFLLVIAVMAAMRRKRTSVTRDLERAGGISRGNAEHVP